MFIDCDYPAQQSHFLTRNSGNNLIYRKFYSTLLYNTLRMNIYLYIPSIFSLLAVFTFSFSLLQHSAELLCMPLLFNSRRDDNPINIEAWMTSELAKHFALHCSLVPFLCIVCVASKANSSVRYVTGYIYLAGRYIESMKGSVSL